MNLAFIRRRFSATGGAENYLERLAGTLVKQGHQVALWCESWGAHESLIQKVEKVDSASPWEFAREIERAKLEHRHDLVFSLERIFGCDIYRAGDGVHAEWMDLRTDYSPVLGRIRNWTKPKNRSVLKLERILFDPAKTRGVIANSKRGKDEIIRHFGFPEERIQVIYNGVPFERFSSGNRETGRKALQVNPDTIVVLLVGAGAERKGHRFARAAVEAVGDSRLKLVIVDHPRQVPMPDLYAAADVFLLPTMYDPFANVTLEALAAGLPVITTIHNGASEIITHGQNGFVLNRADDINGIAKILRSLISSPEARQALAQPARVLAQQFTLERNVSETLAFCEKLKR